ncbi:MAG: alpha-galactosidase [Anaerolineales bacterium]|nr:alpha-galactosidase [Anaerolineales bacterium]
MAAGDITLKQLLGGNLTNEWLNGLRRAWPVSFTFGNERKKIGGSDWCQVGIEARGETPDTCSWRVRLSEPGTGIEANLEIVLYKVERAVQISGTLRNSGVEPIKQLRDPKVLDLSFAPELAPEPFIRRVAGGPFIDVAYPPLGYQIHDVQLLSHYQQWSAVTADCPVDDGRSSVRWQPMMVIGDGHRGGVLVALEWAGAYEISCRRDQPFVTRQPGGDLLVSAGMQGVSTTLAPGEELPLPTAWLLFYQGNLDQGGQAWRRLFRDRFAPPLAGSPVVPFTSYNHWIAYSSNGFTEELAIANARICAEVGIEYMVFDAGWYVGGFRNGNGNWELVDRQKIPSGFAQMGKAVEDTGARFGCWLEPEYAADNSKLFLDHPEWFLQVPVDREAGPQGRARFALMNFGLPEVREWWVRFVMDWYRNAHVRWIRWDFNQAPGPFWIANDSPDRQGLLQIRHIRGLYAALDEILAACPELVVEQCAGGGTRIEPGILRRGHTYWINDQSSSPHLVRFFQHGMNAFWPAHYANMNVVAHDGRLTESEWLSHQAGSFGTSSPLPDWTGQALADLASQVARYKRFRDVLESDFSSETGQPARLRGNHHMAFGHDAERMEIEHNLDDGTVRLQIP